MSDRPTAPVPHRLAEWERRTETPLLVASLVYLAGYAVHVLVPRPTGPWRDVVLVLVAATWLLFAGDYGVRLRLSGQGRRFVRTHWLDTLVLLLPPLRPLRVVQLYTRFQLRRERPLLSLYARVMAYAGTSALLLGFSASLAVYQQERDAPGSTIRTFGDAVWWACATLTTVGYGDAVPVTPLGRVIAAGLMACGLALLGAVTGSFSSWLVQVFSRQDDKRPPEGG
ncbi:MULTISPECIES: potassium channel family protein [Streptomyces]|uniref:Potassium channel family protein n=2 Tax=Streptomyces TaxID=1883 RepID=A0ABU2RT60_9ACTN|nr:MULTISPECIES: potassium channel family protein [unclassified Streptomyces]MBK3595702.1 two pore domain potassium channel family protein [Streptomyces sp. MBT51]MDT0432025.1 potassium channel family protein [Streptomyces sp. DSM 41770]HBF82069.1 ion transporter [Streptomyces sp.]